MPKYTVPDNLSLALALWLTYDEYDYVDESNYISVTGLLKPIRPTVLTARKRDSKLFNDQPIDVMSRFSNRLGTALHDSIDKAWDMHMPRGLKLLGYPDSAIEKFVLFTNETGLPSDEEIKKLQDEGKIIVAREIRMFRKFGNYLIGGKSDFCLDGRVEDFKSVRTYAYGDAEKEQKEKMQISIYRWLRPALFTSNTGIISQLYVDWIKGRSNGDNYPSTPIICNRYELHTEAEVEQFIGDKISKLEHFMNIPEKELPLCTPQELWQKPTVYKWYSDPAKAHQKGSKSTKNFVNLFEAESHKASKGSGKGLIVAVPGKVVACNYCSGFEMCTQKDEYIANGTLEAPE